MNTIETQIVDKILGEIVKAETAADRNPLIDHLYTFLGVVEKRVALSVEPTESRLKAMLDAVGKPIEAEAEKVVAKVESIV